MKLLINDKEIAQFLSSLIDYKSFVDNIKFENVHTLDALEWALEKKGKDQYVPKKHVKKVKNKIQSSIKKDLKIYISKIKSNLKTKKKKDYILISKNIDYFLDKLGRESVLKKYKQSTTKNFVKSIGLQIDKSADLVMRNTYFNVNENCLLRNTVGNEEFLIKKINNRLPFWFIDSGYTNFIENNKKWHRLVQNHLHYGRYFDAPSDRLLNFSKFPTPWRENGNIILIVEPGPFSANIFHINVNQWKHKVEEELRKYTDKKIVFREKFPKKQRTSLYKELLNDDYYCVININSNAATEAIWAGVPVITLDRHISNPVSKDNIADINNLYRGPLGDWLAYLSYSQFTYDELISGEALKIIRKWHV
jgi:hypothetical protein